MKEKIFSLLEQSVKPENSSMIEVFSPQNPEHGDFSTNVAMKIAKQEKKDPLKIAQDLKSKIQDSRPEFIEKIQVIKPGYINFFLKEEVFLNNLAEINEKKDAFGQGSLYQDKKIMIEFAHPNPFKIMHIGHLRNIILGESLVRLYEGQQAKVIRTNYQGDVGLHVAKTLYGILAKLKLKTPHFAEATRGKQKINIEEINKKTINEKVAFLAAAYVLGVKAYEEDKEAKREIITINQKIYEQSDPEINKLWQLGVKWSLEKFQDLYERVYSSFDRQYMESETLELGMKFAKEALKKGILKKSQGAVIFPGEKYSLDTRVFLNKQGFLTYEGKELGLAYMEFTDFGDLDLCIHNVAVEQISFFKVTFKAEELLNPKLFKSKQYHNAYELVGLKKGKMSSRKGNVITAESIIDEAHQKIKQIITENKVKLSSEEIEKIAVSAVKFGFLKMSPFKYLAFDLEKSISFSGDSGPYLQYTYARAKSILRKGKAKNEKLITTAKNTSQDLKIDNENSRFPFHVPRLNSEEVLLLKKLFMFPEVVGQATVKYSPSYLTTYLNELAQLFNNYYSKHQVLGNEFRLTLTAGIAQVIKNGLYLLGIKTLERM